MGSLPEVVGSSLLWAALATLLVMIPGVPLAYALARYTFPGKHVVSSIASLPLVLPPTGVGFILLQLFADDGCLGRDLLGFDLGILLTWKGVVLACAVMSMPLIVRTARVSFEEINPRLESMARTLGHSPLQTFLRITLPLARRGLIASAILGFTRAMGEFGATVILAGSIPGRTQTLASAIYSAQQAGNESYANFLLGVALVIGFSAVFLTEWLTRPRQTRPEGGMT